MSEILSAIGIILVVAGTIFSLWSILSTKGNYVGTAHWFDHQQESFKKDKMKVITPLYNFWVKMFLINIAFARL
jgi:hypothetical protein